MSWAKETTHLTLEIIKRPRALPRRSVVERSFAWLVKDRRLVRDFKQRTDMAETLIRFAAIGAILRRIA